MKKLFNKFKRLFSKENLINTMAGMLTISVILFAIVYAVSNSKEELQSLSITELYESFEKLNNGTKSLSFISRPISNGSLTVLKSKLETLNVDLLDNNTISYDKYCQDSISAENSFTLTDYEVGILWNEIYKEPNTDKLDSFIYEVTITKLDDGYSIKTIASINLSLAYDRTKFGNEITLTTQRVYITNCIKVIGEQKEYTNVIYNDLTEKESDEISTYLTPALKTDLNTYIPNMVWELIETLSLKTNTSLTINDNEVTFEKIIDNSNS